MALTHIVDLESGIAVLGQINDCFDQVNLNTTNINTNTSNIAGNTSAITNLTNTKQNATAVSTLRDNFDSTVITNYTLLGTDLNKMFDITNSGDMTFTLPPTASIAAFLVGNKITIINNEDSIGNVTLTAGAGVTITTGALSAVIASGHTAVIIRTTGNNRYKRIF